MVSLNVAPVSPLGITAFNTFLYYGVQTTTATNALLINSSTPMIIVLISFLILLLVYMIDRKMLKSEFIK